MNLRSRVQPIPADQRAAGIPVVQPKPRAPGVGDIQEEDKAYEEQKYVDDAAETNARAQAYIDMAKKEIEQINIAKDNKKVLDLLPVIIRDNKTLLEKYPNALNRKQAKIMAKDDYAKDLFARLSTATEDDRVAGGWSYASDIKILVGLAALYYKPTALQAARIREYVPYNYYKVKYVKKENYEAVISMMGLNTRNLSTFLSGNITSADVQGILAKKLDNMGNLQAVLDVLSAGDGREALRLQMGSYKPTLKVLKGDEALAAIAPLAAGIYQYNINADGTGGVLTVASLGEVIQKVPDARKNLSIHVSGGNMFHIICNSPSFMNKIVHWNARGYVLEYTKIGLIISNPNYDTIVFAIVPRNPAAPGTQPQKSAGRIYAIPRHQSISIKSYDFNVDDTYICIGIDLTDNILWDSYQTVHFKVNAAMVFRCPDGAYRPYDPNKRYPKIEMGKYMMPGSKAIVGATVAARGLARFNLGGVDTATYGRTRLQFVDNVMPLKQSIAQTGMVATDLKTAMDIIINPGGAPDWQIRKSFMRVARGIGQNEVDQFNQGVQDQIKGAMKGMTDGQSLSEGTINSLLSSGMTVDQINKFASFIGVEEPYNVQGGLQALGKRQRF